MVVIQVRKIIFEMISILIFVVFKIFLLFLLAKKLIEIILYKILDNYLLSYDQKVIIIHLFGLILLLMFIFFGQFFFF
jgi:hypothetical protein